MCSRISPRKELKDSHPGLIRVFGGKEKRVDQDFNAYHALGRFLPEEGAVNPVGPGPGPGQFGPGGANNQEVYFHAWDLGKVEGAGFGGTGPVPGPGIGPRPKIPGPITGKGEKTPGGTGPGGIGVVVDFPPWDRDALVRFIDPDVKPGKTYRYWVRVRMANPNHNKTTKEVAYQELTLHPELPPSEWVETPEIIIPHEYFLYAVDQQMHDDWEAGNFPKKGAITFSKTFDILNATPFQIHQWIESKKDADTQDTLHTIGDWVISERRMIHKGEPIGPRVTVKAPVWYEKKDIFDIPLLPKASTGKKEPKGAPTAKGMHIDMLAEGNKAPILVDFAGGKRLNGNTFVEDTAVDALVLLPDGSLKVFNSRKASDTAVGANPEAKDRIERLTNARKRIDEVMNGAHTHGNDPTMPKGPRGGPGPAGPNLPGGGKGGGS